MEEKDVAYIVFEGEQARNERHIKRLWIVLIVTIIALFISNVLWLIAWTAYDYYGSEVTVSNDGAGDANYIGRNGDINNAEGTGANTDAQEEER